MILLCRLLPLYAGVILIVVAYQRYIGFGPFNSWPELHDWKEPCETNWWTNLLYINNFVKPEAMVCSNTHDRLLHVEQTSAPVTVKGKK